MPAFLLLLQVLAQHPSFYHITTANGLSANEVRALAIDRSGFLWIGTEEGLNVYNGHSINIYLRERQPQLPSNNITQLFCDKLDRIWIYTPEGMVMLNEKREWKNIVLEDTLIRFGCKAIFEIKDIGVVLVTSAGHFYFDNIKQRFQRFSESPHDITYRGVRDVQPFGDSRAIYVTDSSLGVFDFTTRKFIYQRVGRNMISACAVDDATIAVGFSEGNVEIIDIRHSKTIWTCLLRNEISDERINPIPSEIKKAANGDLLINTRLDGLMIIDQHRRVTSYVHDPIRPQSIISNYIDCIFAGLHGEVIIGGSTSGISIYNTVQRTAQFNSFFMDQKGDYYDNFIGRMIGDKNGMIWIGAYDRLIKWDKKNNRSSFFYYHIPNQNTVRRGDIRALCFDKTGQLWISVNGIGIAILDQRTGSFKDVIPDTSLGKVVQSRIISDMMLDRNGLIWVSCSRGIYTIDPVTHAINTFSDDSLLKKISGTRVNSCREDKEGRIWISTIGKGVYCYNKQRQQLFHYSSKEGMSSDISYMTAEDSKGRVFVPSAAGLSIIFPDQTIRTYTRSGGLRYERTESVIIDRDNIAWVTNKKCMVKLDIDNNRMEFFDEKARLLNEGFRVGSYLQTSEGELLWGGYRGVSYYFPGELKNNSTPLQLSIYQAMLRDSLVRINTNEEIQMSYTGNSIIFKYAAVHLGIPGKTYYQYMLEGFDAGWQREEDLGQARYTSLSPGIYTFRVKASMDGINWVESSNAVTLRISPPFWRRWWFFVLLTAIIAGSLTWLIHSRNRKIRKQKEQLEAEQAINYFATSLNEQSDVDDILWDVARNCIGRLQFEDCVIYLYDTDRQMLVQRAAHGPKSSRYRQIDDPIEIPFGKGIVGAVAANGKAETVADTTKDPRYIVDDQARLSEIAVPIISGTHVLGVIDCEHSKKGFFTQKHLFILTTIASLCANKIIRARAEEERQRAQMTLMDTQQKMAEVKMQALRAQMNPHFIFNCLNSINRYIVKSDQVTASLYLTRFAKLIRLILDNSNSKNVILANEVEALKLYIEMEALRFDKKFNYEITVDDEVSLDCIEVPPLIIQPYVENAIWHGLLHKEGGGSLRVHISMAGEGVLQCEIEDNGVGRDKARELKSKSATSRKSLGMKLTEDRLALLNQHAELNASVDIIDLKEVNGEVTGTRVILKIPV